MTQPADTLPPPVSLEQMQDAAMNTEEVNKRVKEQKEAANQRANNYVMSTDPFSKILYRTAKKHGLGGLKDKPVKEDGSYVLGMRAINLSDPKAVLDRLLNNNGYILNGCAIRISADQSEISCDRAWDGDPQIVEAMVEAAGKKWGGKITIAEYTSKQGREAIMAAAGRLGVEVVDPAVAAQITKKKEVDLAADAPLTVEQNRPGFTNN